MTEVLDGNFESKIANDSNDLSLDFYFKGEFDPEVQKEIRKVLLKPQKDASKQSIFMFLFVTLIVGGVGFARRDEDPFAYIAIGLSLATFIIGSWLLLQHIRMRQVLKVFFRNADREIEENPEYELYVTEDYFGQQFYTGTYKFNWTSSIHIRQVNDILLFYERKNSNEPIFLVSKRAVGIANFENLVPAVRNKIAQLKSGK